MNIKIESNFQFSVVKIQYSATGELCITLNSDIGMTKVYADLLNKTEAKAVKRLLPRGGTASRWRGTGTKAHRGTGRESAAAWARSMWCYRGFV